MTSGKWQVGNEKPEQSLGWVINNRFGIKNIRTAAALPDSGAEYFVDDRMKLHGKSMLNPQQVLRFARQSPLSRYEWQS